MRNMKKIIKMILNVIPAIIGITFMLIGGVSVGLLFLGETILRKINMM